MSGAQTIGQNVRFLSTLCWIWCPFSPEDADSSGGASGNGRGDGSERSVPNAQSTAQCIDGETGLVHPYLDTTAAMDDDEDGESSPSDDPNRNDSDAHADDPLSNPPPPYASTFSLTKSFLRISEDVGHRYGVRRPPPPPHQTAHGKVEVDGKAAERFDVEALSLVRLRALKRRCSPVYEMRKDDLLSRGGGRGRGGSFGFWRRREDGVLPDGT